MEGDVWPVKPAGDPSPHPSQPAGVAASLSQVKAGHGSRVEAGR